VHDHAQDQEEHPPRRRCRLCDYGIGCIGMGQRSRRPGGATGRGAATGTRNTARSRTRAPGAPPAAAPAPAPTVPAAARLVAGYGTVHSSGLIWVGQNHLAEAAGYGDTRDEVIGYLRFLGGGSVDEGRLSAFVDRAPEALRFFENCGIRFRVIRGLSDHYYGRSPGAHAAGRSVARRAAGRMRKSSGGSLRSTHRPAPSARRRRSPTPLGSPTGPSSRERHR
jgi:hypothetical protein